MTQDINQAKAIKAMRNMIMVAYYQAGEDEVFALLALMMAEKVMAETFRRAGVEPDKIEELDATCDAYAKDFLDMGELTMGSVKDFLKKAKP